jgi:hypothetical protein
MLMSHRSACDRIVIHRLWSSAALIVIVCAMSVGCAFRGPLLADVSPLRELTLDQNVETLIPLFPTADVIVANGVHAQTRMPYSDGIREMLFHRVSVHGTYDEIRIELITFETATAAATFFDREMKRSFLGARVHGDTQDNRFFASHVQQDRADGVFPMNSYMAATAFQKRNLYVGLHEVTGDRSGRAMEGTIQELARTLSTLSTNPSER